MKRFAVAVALIASSLAMAAPASAAIRDGAKCPKVGQSRTVSVKNVKTRFICVKDGKKLVWRGGPSSQPGGTQPGAVPGGSSGSSGVTEVASSYAILPDTPYTRVSSSAVPSGYLAAAGLASTTGASLYDHPSGLASNGTNLVLVDRGNNRILVWNTAPTSATAVPNFVLCQPSMTSNASGTSLSQCNWPSDAVVTPNGKLLVADSDNHRILVWNTMPTSNGQAASFAIDFGAGAWPWGIWSDGTKVAATLTERGQIKIWNTFPVTGTEAADVTIRQVRGPCRRPTVGIAPLVVASGAVHGSGNSNKRGNSQSRRVRRLPRGSG